MYVVRAQQIEQFVQKGM